jgi:hypothetical protein
VRRADLGEWLRYQLRLQCPGLGWEETPALPETVVRRLQNHDFPDNLRELESLVGRALRQARRQNQNQPPPVLAEEVFWTDQKKERSRFDIWRWKPQLREWMRAPKLWNGLLFGLVSWLFVGVNLALWLGPQTRSENPALNLFRAWWWPLDPAQLSAGGTTLVRGLSIHGLGSHCPEHHSLEATGMAPRGDRSMGFSSDGSRVRRHSHLGGSLESGKYRLAQQLSAVVDHGRSRHRITAVRKTLLVPLSLPRWWDERPVRQTLHP